MYAVIETGGKQFRVELGTEIQIDRLDAAPGDTIELGRVLLLADGDEAQIGRPIVDGATVSASVVRQAQGDKLIVFKYRPKARRRVKHGHRQDLTVVRISDISFNGRSAAKEADAQARTAEAERKKAAEEAARQAAADKALADKLEREQKAAQVAADEAAEDKQPATPTRGRKKSDAKSEAEPKAEAKAKPADGTSTKSASKSEAKSKGSSKAAADPDAQEDADEQPAEPKRPRTKKEE